ncbi:hypothetical protein OBBRIDRAFT_886973 [Obba rivulosa]|uniref:Uncharacterized protein n=1 Tax=Obba rivulosa TaxID=1052685 RepID=A0A8E2B4G4_9APHY|nr:hypothetical protein OBBRIDRAFT_886973 [Obba rivulosa]
MSYAQQRDTDTFQQEQGTGSWPNDPNTTSNTGDRQYANNDPNWYPSAQCNTSSNPLSQAQWDQGSSTPNGQQGQSGDQWHAGRGVIYGSAGDQGDTVDSPRAGQWDQDNAASDDVPSGAGYGSSGQGVGQPSLGQRLKGETEKIAGRVTRDASLTTRGEARKAGNL